MQNPSKIFKKKTKFTKSKEQSSANVQNINLKEVYK